MYVMANSQIKSALRKSKFRAKEQNNQWVLWNQTFQFKRKQKPNTFGNAIFGLIASRILHDFYLFKSQIAAKDILFVQIVNVISYKLLQA